MPRTGTPGELLSIKMQQLFEQRDAQNNKKRVANEKKGRKTPSLIRHLGLLILNLKNFQSKDWIPSLALKASWESINRSTEWRPSSSTLRDSHNITAVTFGADIKTTSVHETIQVVIFLTLVCYHLCFPEASCWHFWSSLTVGLYGKNCPKAFWETQTQLVQNLTPSVWLRFTSSHTVPGARPTEAHLSHGLDWDRSQQQLRHTLQLALSDVSGWSVGPRVSHVLPKPQTVEGAAGLATAILQHCFLTVNVPLFLKNNSESSLLSVHEFLPFGPTERNKMWLFSVSRCIEVKHTVRPTVSLFIRIFSDQGHIARARKFIFMVLRETK